MEVSVKSKQTIIQIPVFAASSSRHTRDPMSSSLYVNLLITDYRNVYIYTSVQECFNNVWSPGAERWAEGSEQFKPSVNVSAEGKNKQLILK